MYDIITIGSATMDVFLISKQFKIIKSKEFKTGYGECFSHGSKIELGDIYFDTGGGSTNAAYTFRNFRLKTSIITRVGKDMAGENIKQILGQKKMHTDQIVVDKSDKTAYSTILLTQGGERTILVYRGVSDDFKKSDIKWDTLRTKWIYLTSLGGNQAVLRSIFQNALKHNINIAWNPGSRELKMPATVLKSFIKRTKLLILNREEASALTRTNIENTHDILEKLQSMTTSWWTVSDGKLGAYISDQQSIYHAPAPKVRVVNTTGAGDAFGSAVTAALIKKKSAQDALRIGSLNAGGVITEMGAKNGLLKSIPSNTQLLKIKIKEIII